MQKDLIEKYISGNLSEEKVKELMNWVQESADNRTYFANLKNLWVATQLENENPDINIEDEYRLVRYRTKMRSGKDHPDLQSSYYKRLSIRKTIRKALQVAAIIIFLYSIIGTYIRVKRNSKTDYTEIRTKRGEKSFLKLADGTLIWLNAETVFRYPSRLDSKNVRVFLDGEAYFDVAKNPNRNFIVQASSLDITVIGTSFNVKSYSMDNTIETTLEEGKISITGRMGNKQIKEPVVLIPNQRATFIKNNLEYSVKDITEPPLEKENTQTHSMEKINTARSPQIILAEQIDSKLYTSWKDGKMIFKSKRFEDLALQMERWYDVKIDIIDQELKDIKYTGVFEKETIEQALHALSLSLPFHYEIDQNEITIRKPDN
jgi:ferric-dicitrate binding protein FerR (iron transport regulator)